MTGAGQQHNSGSSEIGSKYVLKRIFTERGPRVRLAGLREAYFGRLLQNNTAVLQVAFAHSSVSCLGTRFAASIRVTPYGMHALTSCCKTTQHSAFALAVVCPSNSASVTLAICHCHVLDSLVYMSTALSTASDLQMGAQLQRQSLPSGGQPSALHMCTDLCHDHSSHVPGTTSAQCQAALV